MMVESLRLLAQAQKHREEEHAKVEASAAAASASWAPIVAEDVKPSPPSKGQRGANSPRSGSAKGEGPGSPRDKKKGKLSPKKLALQNEEAAAEKAAEDKAAKEAEL